MEPLSVREICDGVRKALAPHAAARNVVVTIAVGEDVPEKVTGDADGWTRALESLMAYAVQHAASGAVELQSEMASELAVVFSIRWRGGNENHEALENAQRIVQALGGSVAISPTVNGHAVTFLLPVESDPDAAVERTGQPDEEGAQTDGGGDGELLRELAVLFLEEYPSQIGGVRSAVAAKNAQQLESSAHLLKGSLFHFGAQEAAQAALALELKGRTRDLTGIDESLEDLEAALDPTLARLRELAGG